MKAGDIVEFDQAPGWYAWLKHQIRGEDNAPMSLGRGAWIVGIYSGETLSRAIQSGEIAELVEAVRRNSKITKRGFIPVHEKDVVFPTFLSYRSIGKGKNVVFLCHGYDHIREVDPSEIASDIRFACSLDISGIAHAVNEGYFNRLVEESKRHPLKNPGL